MPRTVITRSSTSGGGRTIVHRASAASGGRTTVQRYRNPVTGQQQGVSNPVDQLKKAAAVHVGPGPAMGPIGAVLNFVSQPVYAVGSALQGHPLEAARHLAQLVPVVQAAEHIPGISGPARAALNPRENILPADVSYIHRAIQAIPNRYARAAVGFTANVALDPTTYLTFGAGGVARSAASTAARAAVVDAGEAAIRAATEEGLSTAQRLLRIGRAHADSEAAQVALRAERGPGVHVGLRVPFTRGKTVGEQTLRVPRPISRAAAPITAPAGRLAARIGATRPVEGVVGAMTSRGGVDRVGWAARQGIRRAAVSEKQVITHEAKVFHNDFTATVKRLADEGATAEGGGKLTVEAAYRNLAHHLDQPRKFELLHPDLAPFAEKARETLSRYHRSEAEAGLAYQAVKSYIPHVLPKTSDRLAFVQRYGKPSGTNPFFVHAREVPTLEGLEHLGFTPETNVARLLELRGHASLDTLAAQQTYRVLAERGGLRAPLQAPVDVGAKAIELSQARARLAQAKEIRPTWNQQTALASARQDVGAAQVGARAAGKQPYFAAQMRATRNLVQARQLREGARPLARTGEGVLQTPAGSFPVTSVEHGRQILKEARSEVERARKHAAAAQRLKDPVAIRQARQQLTRAIHTHMDARIALGAARGRTVGTPAEIERATRGLLKSQRELTATERQAARVAESNRRLRQLPGEVATPEQWAQVHKDWHEMPGQWLKGVRVDDKTHAVINRMRDEIAASMRRPEDVQAFVRFTQKLTGRWKSLALLSPGYHIRNIQGDAILAWWAGARNPVSFVQSARLLKSGRGSLASITIRGKTYTRDEFMRLARSQGAIGQGQAGAEIRGAQEAAAGTRFARSGVRRVLPKSLPGTGVAARASQAVGQAREDAMRLGTFIERLKAGDDVITAGNKVHEYHFDYADISPFVRQARQFWAPFITFASKAAPLTVKQVARNPGFFSHYARATEAANQAAGDPNLDQLRVGDRLSFGIPDPLGVLHSALGAPRDQPLLYNPERVLPFGTLNQLDPTQIQRQLIAQYVSPFITTPIEVATGHQFFKAGAAPKREFAPYPIEGLHRLGIPIPGYGPKKDPLTGQPMPGYSSSAARVLGLLPQFGQASGLGAIDENTARRRALSFFAGLPVQPYDRARALALAAKYGK